MTHSNTQAENELQRIASLASRLSYEIIQIRNNFCVDGFLSNSDYTFMNSIGNKLILVLEKELSKLERSAEKINALYHKNPEII